MASLGSSAGASPSGPPRLIPCDVDRPTCPGDISPNVLLLSGFPWYCTEGEVAAYLQHVYPDVAPITTRLYTFPHNGASRGICFVEYPRELTSSPAPPRSHSVVASYPRPLPFALTSSMALPPPPVDGAGKVDLARVQHRVTAQPFEQEFPLQAQRCYLTQTTWDRAGLLPPLPSDLPLSGKPGQLVGFGDEGRLVRCGAHLEVANTCAVDSISKVERCRKRLRVAMERQVNVDAAA